MSLSPEASIARRALSLLDLTDLSEGLDLDGVERLCARAVTRHGPVAAVCLWPQFVGHARRFLNIRPVRVAAVVNFPAGGLEIEKTVSEARRAIALGADEIDLVLPWAAFAAGERQGPGVMLRSVRTVVPRDRVLKVILETGELKEEGLIRAAADFALTLGATFIKTSTGKTPVSATPDAAAVMLEAVKAFRKPAGFKASGGIRTVADAGTYLALADRIMGPRWATPATFRFGASGLLDQLLAALEGTPEPPVAAARY